MVAVDDHLVAGVQLAEPCRQLVDGDEAGTRERDEGVLPLLPDVEDVDGDPRVEARLELGRGVMAT